MALSHRQLPDAKLADIWSIGATLYRMLTGTTPYRGTIYDIRQQMKSGLLVPPNKTGVAVCADLENICMKALAREPEDRYRTALELVDDLTRYLEGRPTLAKPIRWHYRLRKWILRNRTLALLTATTVLIFVGLLIGWGLANQAVAKKNRDLLERELEFQSSLVKTVLSAEPESLGPAVERLQELAQPPLDLMRAALKNTNNRSSQRLNAAIALTEFGDPQLEFLIQSLVTLRLTSAYEANVAAAMRKYPTISQRQIRTFFDETNDSRIQIRLAILDARLGSFELLESICRGKKDPTARTQLIMQLGITHLQIAEYARLLNSQIQADALFALASALALIDPQQYSPPEQDLMQRLLQSRLADSTDSGVTAALRLALIRWAGKDLTFSSSNAGATSRYFQPDLLMIRVEPGVAKLGYLDSAILHTGNPMRSVKITEAFYLADREVSVRQFREFLDDNEYPLTDKPIDATRIEPEKTISPTDECPMQQVSWIDAIQFCNWLSRRHSLQPRYLIDRETAMSAEDSSSLRIEGIRIAREANGFRLPTEDQWEYAARAQTATDYSFGNNVEWLKFHGAFSNARLQKCTPCGVLLPNSWGFHDMHGNVWEWCEDCESPGSAEKISLRGVADGIARATNRVDNQFLAPEMVIRGGGVATMSGEPTSAAKGTVGIEVRFQNLGFRVALPESAVSSQVQR